MVGSGCGGLVGRESRCGTCWSVAHAAVVPLEARRCSAGGQVGASTEHLPEIPLHGF